MPEPKHAPLTAAELRDIEGRRWSCENANVLSRDVGRLLDEVEWLRGMVRRVLFPLEAWAPREHLMKREIEAYLREVGE